MAMIVTRVAAGVAGTAALLAAAVLSAPSSVAQAVAGRTAGPQAQGARAGDPGGFIAESRRELAALEDELVRLAAPLAAVLEKTDRQEGSVENQRLKVQAAEAAARVAQLKREAAEAALKEYQGVTLKQERAARDGALKAAQDDMKRAEPGSAQARERLAKIKPSLKGSTTDLAIQWNLEGAIVLAELQKKKAELAIEMAQHKLKILDEHESKVRVRRMRSDIESARSDELSTQATRAIEQRKLRILERARDVRAQLSDRQARILSALERAIPLEEQWTAQLETLEKTGEAGEAARQQLRELATQLRGIVERERAVQDAAAWTELKAKIERGATAISQRGGEVHRLPTRTEPAVAAGGDFLAASRDRLRELRGEIARLGRQLPDDIAARLRDQLVNQQIAEKSAEASYENAKLTREVAEIGVTEYEQGIYVQDELTAQGELLLAQSDFERSKDTVTVCKDRLAEIRDVSRGTPYDLMNEYAFQDKLAEAEQRLPRSRLALEAAQAKLDHLKKFTRDRVVKEHKCEVEKARADELAKQASWETEKARLKALVQAIAQASRPNGTGRLLAGLDRAVKAADQLQTKLDSLNVGSAAGAATRAEIATLTETLAAAIESARAEQATLAWAKLKEQVRGLTAQDPSAKAK
jgi:hypothetical protein